jgi:aspartyl-tRNA synthetase
MCSAFERYFQTARALRDEDPRADRGFEHTQVDIEMSFVEREDVMQMVEGMVTAAAEKLGFTIREKPFPRISYKDAMAKYGADKFDMRTEEEKATGVLAYAWVIDFPFFERDTKSGRWTFTHNPFSNPLPEFREDHLAWRNTENILTSQYDLVCNGYESGGGSIRAHEAEVLEATYKTMGYSKEEIENSVGHMLEAFRFGAPPHGGIALGVERNLMNLTGETALREVVAFPMTASGTTSVMEAPTQLDVETLLELSIKTTEKKG